MDNKLSELSKPVAWEVKGILCHSEEEARVYVGEPERLYSQEYVSSLTQRIAELEAQKSELQEYTLNEFEVATLTMTLRNIDVYLPEFLRYCAIHRVDQGVIIDKLIDQSAALKRVKKADYQRDMEACDE